MKEALPDALVGIETSAQQVDGRDLKLSKPTVTSSFMWGQGQHGDGQNGRTWPLGNLSDHAIEGLMMQALQQWRDGYAVKDPGGVLCCMKDTHPLCDPEAFEKHMEPVVRDILAEGIYGEEARK